jgi:hypothetical protein
VAAPANALATAGVLILASLAITAEVPSPSPLMVVVVPAVFALVAWMLVSERYEWTLVVLMLYIGLADGYLKLRTDTQSVTLLRDALLYAIATGALVRIAVRRERVSLPPLSGWVIAWIAVVAVQVFNPYNGTLLHSIASVRPHLEWVPLFFLGYLIMRSRARLRNFLLLLLVVAAANGIVGLVQQNLTPEQLASWGPGYERALNGESSVSARTFADEEGNDRNRPFALGGDIGFGGAVGFLAVPAALALIGLSLKPPVRIAIGALSIGVVLAIITSAARVHVIAGVVAVLAFAGLTVTSRGGLRAVLAIAAGVAIGYVALGFLFSHGEKGDYDRYQSISNPSAAVDTAFEYRGGVIAKVPDYAEEIPLGAGLGSRGPAGSFAGGAGRAGFNGESEPTYLLIELGLPGLLVMVGFNLALLYLSVTRIRRIEDRETRVLLTAIAAPLFALAATWFAGVATASVPGAPYMWFAAGVLSYWLLTPGSESPVPANEASLADAGAKARWARWSTA